MTAKETILNTINAVIPVNDYNGADYVFSGKYGITATDMIYIMQILSESCNIEINEALIDSLENCTFARLEELVK